MYTTFCYKTYFRQLKNYKVSKHKISLHQKEKLETLEPKCFLNSKMQS